MAFFSGLSVRGRGEKAAVGKAAVERKAMVTRRAMDCIVSCGEILRRREEEKKRGREIRGNGFFTRADVKSTPDLQCMCVCVCVCVCDESEKERARERVREEEERETAISCFTLPPLLPRSSLPLSLVPHLR
jgi:hypothetical protein